MNGQKMCVDKWSSNEPNSEGDPVLMIGSGLWDDYGGDLSNYFIEVFV